MSGGYFIWCKDKRFSDQRVSFRDFKKDPGKQTFHCEVNKAEVPIVVDPELPATHVELDDGKGPYLLDEASPPVVVGKDQFGDALVKATFK